MNWSYITIVEQLAEIWLWLMSLALLSANILRGICWKQISTRFVSQLLSEDQKQSRQNAYSKVKVLFEIDLEHFVTVTIVEVDAASATAWNGIIQYPHASRMYIKWRQMSILCWFVTLTWNRMIHTVFVSLSKTVNQTFYVGILKCSQDTEKRKHPTCGKRWGVVFITTTLPSTSPWM